MEGHEQLSCNCMVRSSSAVQADCIEGRLLVNPGSATGAFNTFRDDVIPSFVLMDVSGKKVSTDSDQH